MSAFVSGLSLSFIFIKVALECFRTALVAASYDLTYAPFIVLDNPDEFNFSALQGADLPTIRGPGCRIDTRLLSLCPGDTLNFEITKRAATIEMFHGSYGAPQNVNFDKPLLSASN
ncbi:MAG: hypothetical protein C0622_08705 [Desulfuromonas sp.]|nr:MAG: hypothetical protein C0622_08705 [Desulfuromonas sp.]